MHLLHLFEIGNRDELTFIGCYPITPELTFVNKILSTDIQKFLIAFFLENIVIPLSYHIANINFELLHENQYSRFHLKPLSNNKYYYFNVCLSQDITFKTSFGDQPTFIHTYIAYVPEAVNTNLKKYLTHPDPIVREYLKQHPLLLN